ncbi:uncharacterized protein LOC132891579 isoform X1 [Neoarius graeffei]|uniref:uncharacterized protein LOC132891579 isoform X1 n=1 Tax=Neoarius graeffei TaxID=443677 RepID=UPI00298BEBBB|nr:uncharacterized protein LOC132891579 isoform X1 [Neoarius graeffei]XP_060785272.1 uncharacterized protein LOC132891579 isoform X1 [Neoarius graeffei]
MEGRGVQQRVSIRDAAQNLLSVLQPIVQQLPDEPVGTSQPQSNLTAGQQPTVHQEMARSFPGLFQRGQRGRKRPYVGVRQNVSVSKTCSFIFYLLPKTMSRTPQPSDEVSYLMSGLGRRNVSMSEDSDHTQITSLLTQEFPKMGNLTGGWLLYKASGGTGQRKLSLLPPEAEGYSARQLKIASNNGKNTLFIMPLQEELDTTPLPQDDSFFSKMPKSDCKKCGSRMPVHVLLVHLEKCQGTLQDSEACDEIPEDNATCPVCSCVFSSATIEMHASMCGERDIDPSDGTVGGPRRSIQKFLSSSTH